MRVTASGVLLCLVMSSRPASPSEDEGAAPKPAPAAPASDLKNAAVTLPWSEVKRLMEEAREAERMAAENAREPGPPTDALVNGAGYRAVVGRSSTEFEARLDVDLLADGWHRVPLLGIGPSITSALLDGRPARLALDDEWYSLVARGQGRRSLVLRFVVPRGTEAGDSNLDVRVAASARNHLDIEIPRPGIAVAVDPGGGLRRTERRGVTYVSADFPQTEHLRINWSGALPEKEVEKVRLLRRCAVSQLVSVGGGLIRLDARLTFSILQGKVERFDLQLPADATLLDVAGDVVREHRVVKRDGGSAVAVSLIRPVTGDFTVRVQAERAVDGRSGVAAVPELRILDVDREWGHIGIDATTNIEIAPSGSHGLTQVDVKELPADVWQLAQHPVLLSYRYVGHPYELLLDIKKHEDLPVLASSIDSAFVTTFQTSDGKILHSALLQTKNTHKQFLKVKLPPRTSILAAFVSDLPVKPATNEAGEILVPLQKSVAGGSDQRPFPVELLYLEEGRRMGAIGRAELRVLSVDIPISVFRWTLYLPRPFTYWGFSGALEKGAGWDPTPRGSDPAARQAVERLESAGLQSGDRGAQVGLLPVRINLPASGLRTSFQTELVMPKDSPPAISFRFVGEGLTRALRVVVGLLALLVAVRAGLVLMSMRKGSDVTFGLKRLTWAVGGLLFVVALETWALGASVPIVAAALIAAILCTDMHMSARAGVQASVVAS